MRIVFFGTPAFAVPSLRALLREQYQVVGVVTQPDRPQGRSRSRLVAPPVKLGAQAADLTVLQPVRPLGDVFLAGLRRLEPELGVVVAYGHILRPEVLRLPRLGMINVHASLLPRWRGAAPVQHAILAGDTETGVSIMQMDQGLDSGPVLHRAATPIGPDETAGALATRLAELGAASLIEALSRLTAGSARAEPQDAAAMTLAPKIDREQARLDWARPAVAVARQVRAFDPAPGAWTSHDGAPLKLFGAVPIERRGAPGCVLAADDRLVVGCGEGAVSLSEVQPAGRNRLPVADWVRGRSVAVGTLLA
ncbi:MAG TPA: methionyl-tRNA formyltransferase [Gemmatimonadales bacterium]|nr:methionyl-tRNA formyltransferase [Gemmatimonadales bacterium]